MIAVNNISKSFGKLKVLENVSLTGEQGQCIALIGPNGCGKTTLIKAILGMVVIDAGDILFNNQTIKHQVAYRSKLGYMPQIGRYPDNMTIGQVVSMIKSIRNDQAHLDEELLHTFNLPSLYDKRMRTLSGGTRQKVSAVLAFLFSPDVLILDEPTAGLDPIASEQLKEKIIKEKQKGKLIIITSHLLNELDDLVTDIVYMQEGLIKFQKPIAELLLQTNEQKISKAIASILKQSHYA